MFFKKLFSKFIINEKLILGRWKINYSEKYLDRKIYLANYDNCGPCGSIKILPKVKYKSIKKY